jgi:hypothetical protein
MRNNVFLSFLLSLSALLGTTANSKRGYTISPADRAVLYELQIRDRYLPAGSVEKLKNYAHLVAITHLMDNQGPIDNRVNHLMIHGVNSQWRKEAIKIAAEYLKH